MTSKMIGKFKSLLAPTMDMCVFQGEKGSISYGLSKWKGKGEDGKNIYEKQYLSFAELHALYAFANEMLDVGQSAYQNFWTSKPIAPATPAPAIPTPVPPAIVAVFPGSTAVLETPLPEIIDDIPF